MEPMTTPLSWADAALRLLFTVVAGLALGYNRSEHGKAAGMRTTLLVCLAASVAMMQANVLLPMQGRSSTSFVMNDLMRLPLGILTGVGFIGGGAILRRGNLVRGVTTAATLWLATVVGLCLGGGQTPLGLAATLLGLGTLTGLKRVETVIRQACHARLLIETGEAGPDEADLRSRLTDQGLSIVRSEIALDCLAGRRTYIFEVRSWQRSSETSAPQVVHDIAADPNVQRLRWQVLV